MSRFRVGGAERGRHEPRDGSGVGLPRQAQSRRLCGPKLLPSEMGHLAERARNTFLLGAEVDEDGDVRLDPDDLAETIRVVDDPVAYGVPITHCRDRILERAGG
jgi:hypothetical protein